MNRTFRETAPHGFTLVELLIALALLAIVLLVSAPQMQRLVSSNRLHSEMVRLRTAVNMARNEAVVRNIPASLCPSSYAETRELECTGDYSGGWIVFSNRDRDDKFDVGDDELIRAFSPLPAGYRMTDRTGTRLVTKVVTYAPDGATWRNLTLMVCPPSGVELASWSVVINYVGRVRVAQGWGDCQ